MKIYNDLMMSVLHYETGDLAIVARNDEGPCIIEWHNAGGPPWEQSNGWLQNGVLYVLDNETRLGKGYIDGRPDCSLDWYRVDTGERLNGT